MRAAKRDANAGRAFLRRVAFFELYRTPFLERAPGSHTMFGHHIDTRGAAVLMDSDNANVVGIDATLPGQITRRHVTRWIEHHCQALKAIR